MNNPMALTLEGIISKLDGAAGRLIVASMTDATVREAMEMITDASIILGEVEEIKFYDYGPEYREDGKDV